MRIDLDQSLLCRPGWVLRPEDQLPMRAHGQIDFDPAHLSFFTHSRFEKEAEITGRKLLPFLKDQPVLPDVILDLLLERPRWIHRFWIGTCIPFWGSLYRRIDVEEFLDPKQRRPDDDLYIRNLVITERGIHERALSLYAKHDRTFRIPIWR